MKAFHPVVTDSFKFLLGTITGNALLFVQGIVVARILGPAWFGVWSIFMVILSYSHHSHSGVIHGMNKEVPFLRGKKQDRIAEKVVNTSFWVTTLIGAFVTFLILLISFGFDRILSHDISSGFKIIAFIIFFYIIYLFLISLLRVDKNFNLLSVVVAAVPFISLAIMLLLFKIMQNKLHAALFALLGAYFLISLIILLFANYRFSFSLDFKVFKKTFLVGLPLITISLGYTLYISIDRWLVARFLDRFQLSYYSLGATFGHFLVGLIAVVAFVLYPRMLERYGETNDIESLREMTVISSFFVSFITAMFVSMGIIIIPVFLRFFLPAYLPAVKTVKIFLLAVYFLSFSPIMGNCLISINHQRKIIVTQIAAFLLCLTTDYLLIKKGLGINYIAVGTGFSFFLYSTALAYAAFASFFKGRLQIIKEIARIYLPFAANILCLFVLISMFRLPFALFCYNPFALLLVQILFCLVVNGYILVYLNKRYKILARLLPVGLQK